jgi:cytochrome c556
MNKFIAGMIGAVLFICILPRLAMAEDLVGVEQRMEVNLSPENKQFVLGYMRAMLETLTESQQHLSVQQPLKVAVAAQKLMDQAQPVGLGKQLPVAFKAMSKQMNIYWNHLAQPSTDVTFIQENMVAVMQQCNACHRSFVIK